MSKIKEYIKLLQSSNVPFEKQQEALQAIEQTLKEAKIKKELLQTEGAKTVRGAEFIRAQPKELKKVVHEEIKNYSQSVDEIPVRKSDRLTKKLDYDDNKGDMEPDDSLNKLPEPKPKKLKLDQHDSVKMEQIMKKLKDDDEKKKLLRRSERIKIAAKKRMI